MKNMTRKGWILGFLICTVWFMMGNAVSAEEKTYQGFEYRIVMETRYKGNEYYGDYSSDEEENPKVEVEDLVDELRVRKSLVITGYVGTDTEVVIPDVIEGISVVEIADSAFANNKTMKKVTIPNTIDDIGIATFSNCSNLEAVYLGDLETVPAMAFANCKKLKKVYGNPKFYCEEAFLNCTALQNVCIPKGEEPKCINIEVYAFAGCKNLRELKMYGQEEEVSLYGEIAYGAFYNCKKLKKIEVTNRPMWVSERAFYGCTSLEKVIGVSCIYQDAFNGCKKLKEIEFRNLNRYSEVFDKNALRNTNPKVKFRVAKKEKKFLQKALTKKTGYKKTMKIVVLDNQKKNTK